MAAGPDRIIAMIDKIEPVYDLRGKIIQHPSQPGGSPAHGTPEGEEVAAVKRRFWTKMGCTAVFHERKERHFVAVTLEPLHPTDGMDAAGAGHHGNTQ
jgi:hypothetical protein